MIDLRKFQDLETKSEIQILRAENRTRELEERLSTRLAFGTAGLRARMGAGFARLNSLTIIQTSQGFAEFILSASPNARESGIVLGYDARHNSKKFAQLAASVFESKGITVWLYEDLVHTPMVPYAVKFQKAAAGIMITASHNPAQDNGYKVYGSNGCQINTPDDALIAASILRNLEPKVWKMEGSPLRKPMLGLMMAHYFTSVITQLKVAEAQKHPIKFVYTPMHGVGLRYMAAVVDRAGIEATMTVVDQQAEPDPDFPTVKYPNPEEKGALDLATRTADERNAGLVLANDPDADRFAAAEKVGDVWHQFTGDQVGVLLADWLYCQFPRRTPDDIMLISAVSSQMLSSIADAEGFSVQETLTGFKWLGNAAKDLRDKGKRVHFAYEEALGYMFPDVVYDKDGIAAAMVFLRACASWGSPWAKLQELYEKYGYFVTANTYWRSPTVQKTQTVFQGLRKREQPFPGLVGQRRVNRWRDLTSGYDSANEDNVPDLPVSASSQMITCWLDGSNTDDGIRFTVRASGTEPKIKIYLECRAKDHDSANKGAMEMLGWLKRKWFTDPELQIEEKFANV
ncbi:MAG: hypothetical protein LQ338_006881 [Usnochroma carphineum]|nr:MAG: hypothetical protein LQ338_006881 [Usnochroma carphineum]